MHYSFPPPKSFTNSLLHSHDITALIRDTEAHERALFKLDSSSQAIPSSSTIGPRRDTVHRVDGTSRPYGRDAKLSRNPKFGSAAATLLGGELGEQIRLEGSKEARERGEIDVTLLLKGAEKLCGV